MNVNLWFAKNSQGEIVTISSAHNDLKYTCPICSSEVIPKAVKSKKVKPHFAHIDRNKCNSESMIHFWMKNKFIEVGEQFKINTDEELTFTCESFETEKIYKLTKGIYKPDLVIHTECGNEIIFEMANSNKKKVEHYIDKWIELDKIVVEVDLKNLTDDVRNIRALYYKGKCYNFNNRDGGYYNTIGKMKEAKYDIQLVKSLDWFWESVNQYNNNQVDIIYMANLVKEISNDSNKAKLLNDVMKSSNCSTLRKDLIQYYKLDDYYVIGILINPINNLIYELNEIFNNLDPRISIKTKMNKIPIYETYYTGSRRNPYKKRIKACKYSFDVKIQSNNRTIETIKYTNRLHSKKDLFDYLKNEIIKILSKKYKCKKCNEYFEIKINELNYYINKNLNLRKTCKNCIKNK